MKGAQKPKKLAKKAPQKTLKERRSEKQAKKKGAGGIYSRPSPGPTDLQVFGRCVGPL